MQRRTYDAIAFRQQEKSPIQVAFVAPAGHILEWSGIPRKSDELLTGYQRFRDDDRIRRDIVPYFSDPENCSPTAAIVALRTDSALGSWTLEKEPSKTEGIITTKLIVEFRDEELHGNAVFESALKYVNDRLLNDVESQPDGAQDDEDSDDEQEESDDEEENEEEGPDEIHLGSETLRKMQELLEDRSNWSRPDFKASISDFVKPAVLIDGQHRVTAAAKISDAGLPFLVCGLYGASWSEQVFQFTVVNLKPKRIPPALITSIAALSLTRREQATLKDRLKGAGIRMKEVELMSSVAYDDASPFAEKVNMAVGKRSETLLGYAEIKRIANVWHGCRQTLLVHLARSIFATNNASHARATWKKTKTWFEFFVAFWDTVRAQFGDDIWLKTPNNRLFVASNLWALQDAIFMTLNRFPKATWDVDGVSDVERKEKLRNKLGQEVATLCKCFPREFWTAKWHSDYLSAATSQKRNALSKRFDEFISEGTSSSLGYWKGWKTSKIITGDNP